MRRRRRFLAFWLLIVAILFVNYALIHWLAPASDDPAVSSTAHPAVSAAANRAVSAAANRAVSAAANRAVSA